MDKPANPFLPLQLSPSAYELGRYGRTPVSYFHGLPNISIPLTEVRAKGFTLPVTISYHAGGNKPEQHPGWVGLGWSLQAGGSIVRVVNGLKDEMSKTELSPNGGEVDYLSHIDEVQTETDWEEGDNLYTKTHNPNGLSLIDYSPDEYIINAPGIHASFYITGKNQITVVAKDESAIELERCDVVESSGSTLMEMYPGKHPKKIEANRFRYIRSFIIRDKNGNRYIFGGNDSAIEYSVVQKDFPGSTWDSNRGIYIDIGRVTRWSNVVATANAWMLTRIERTNGKVHYDRPSGGEVPEHQSLCLLQR